MSKYKRGLYIRAKEQQQLKDKYGYDDIIDEISTPNPLYNAFSAILRIVIIIIFIFFAVVGLLALIIPACRQEMLTALHALLLISL